MTWEKFQRTVMQTADKIEVMVDNPNRLMALVTAVDETSETSCNGIIHSLGTTMAVLMEKSRNV